ncbi:hypothetical protein N2E09_04610 [Leuconostoc citreum]
MKDFIVIVSLSIITTGVMNLWNNREKASDKKIKQLKIKLLEKEIQDAKKTDRTK